MLIDFTYESSYLEETIEALNEDTIIEKFGKMNINSGEKIQIINETVLERQDNMEKISDKCIRKLIILLLFNEKESEKREIVFRKIYDMKKYQKILFNILLYCDKYLNSGAMQLNLLKEHIDKIRYDGLDGDSYKDDQQLV